MPGLCIQDREKKTQRSAGLLVYWRPFKHPEGSAQISTPGDNVRKIKRIREMLKQTTFKGDTV